MPPRLTIEDARREAEKRGGECLSETYTNTLTLLRWRCAKGHEWEAKFVNIRSRGAWCPKCAGCAKLSIEDCRRVAEERGGECISEIYRNTDSKLRWRCSAGHEWEAKLNHVKDSGSWCPHCAGSLPLGLEEAQRYAATMGGECLSEVYKNQNHLLRWRCAKGHEWESPFRNMHRKAQWCPHCAGNVRKTLDEIQAFAAQKGGKCLSEEYQNANSYLLWECSEGHQWQSRWNDVAHRGSWCEPCSRKERRLGIEVCHEIAAKNGGKCLSEEYTLVKDKYLWECASGHQWESALDNVLNGGHWCPFCVGAKNEAKAHAIFEELTGKCFERRVKKMTTNGRLEFDGYCEELRIAFEYDGIQHHEYSPYFHRNGPSDLEAQQARDFEKDQEAIRLQIVLIRVRYDQNARQVITRELRELGVI